MTRQTSPFGLGRRTQRWLPDLTAKMIPLREGLDPLQMLTSASQVAEWQNERLPSDQISIENGGIITQVCARLPHATASREVATAASRRMKQKKQVDAHTNSQIYCPVLRLIFTIVVSLSFSSSVSAGVEFMFSRKNAHQPCPVAYFPPCTLRRRCLSNVTKRYQNERAQCQRWPLMIDPQLQGIRWLRRHEEVATEANERSLHVLQMGEVRYCMHRGFRGLLCHRMVSNSPRQVLFSNPSASSRSPQKCARARQYRGAHSV